MTIYILLFILPLLFYAVLSATIIFHLKKYGIPGDFSKQILTLFFIVTIALVSLTAWGFFSVPWDQLDFMNMINNIIKNYIVFFQQQ